jgi:D-alanyl-D-alanine carboxypeptidase
MPDDFDIETVEVEDGYYIDSRVCDALQEMLADCRAAGYSPRLISTFRTRETQQYLYDHTANKADTAVPGHSEHECGLAADIIDADSLGWADPLIAEQEDMPAQKWLMEHCQDYGFILRYPADKEDITEIIYEPWHYRYVGKEHAANIMENGLCLEEYIENMEDYYEVQ